MRFVPKYTVSYDGEIYMTGEEFDIDPDDADEMRQHGEIVEESTPQDGPEEITEPDGPLEEKPKRGRRPKNDKPGANEAADG